MNEDRLADIDGRLREVEQALASLLSTQRLIGLTLLVLIPVITTLAVKLIT